MCLISLPSLELAYDWHGAGWAAYTAGISAQGQGLAQQARALLQQLEDKELVLPLPLCTSSPFPLFPIYHLSWLPSSCF